MVKETKKSTGVDMQKLIDQNNLLWEAKYEESLKKYEQKMEDIQDHYEKQLKDKTLLFDTESNALTQKHKKELQKAMKKYTDLKEVHDQEVKDLFENIGTLKFVKEMRFFKKEWDEQITEKKRKKVAAAMANATKAWVGDGEKL